MLIDEEVSSDEIKQLLTMALRKLDQEVGRSVDSEHVATYMKRLVEFFLDDPFTLDSISAVDFKDLHELAIGRAELVEEGGAA